MDLHICVCEWGLGVHSACVGLCVSESWGFGRVYLSAVLRGMRCAPVCGHGQVGIRPGYVLQWECVPARSVVYTRLKRPGFPWSACHRGHGSAPTALCVGVLFMSHMAVYVECMCLCWGA